MKAAGQGPQFPDTLVHFGTLLLLGKFFQAGGRSGEYIKADGAAGPFHPMGQACHLDKIPGLGGPLKGIKLFRQAAAKRNYELLEFLVVTWQL